MGKPQGSVIASWIAPVLMALLGMVPATGATVYGFEGDSGNLPTYPGKTPDGWYVPNVPNTGGASAGVSYPTLGTYGIFADPGGGNEALALTGATDPASAKAQLNVNFSSAQVWTVSYDLSMVNLASSGNTDNTDWIGGFAPQSTTGNYSDFFILNGWDNGTTGSTWSAYYYAYDASGNPLGAYGVSAGAAWTGLDQNHWYVESTTFNDVTDQILSVSITVKTTDVTATFDPTGWYMAGGSTPLAGLDSIRLWGWGSTNAMIVDNVTLSSSSSVPEPASFPLVGTGVAVLGLAARRLRGRGAL